MMQITYQAPDQSADEIKKASAQVAYMQALVAELTKAGNQPDNKYYMLTKQDRDKLVAQGYPKTLVNNVAFFTEQVNVPQGEGFVEQDLLMVGFTSDAFNPDLYASDAIKDALIQSHWGRCAYCETLINQATYGDVEHFRPKAAYTTPWSSVMFRPAYYFLAYDPTNLFYSCQLCNEAYKQNAFPVIGDRAPLVPVSKEMAILINPYVDDPRSYIRFNPMNGYAYAFDLTQSFYMSTQGWSPSQTATEIWKDPTKIPGQKNYQGIPISNSAVDKAYQAWLPTVTNPQLQRGTQTINALYLNRLALVRARMSHLRHMRGMVWATSGTGSDQVAAQQLLTALLSTDPARVAVCPEYLSLTTDALQTWNNQGGATFSWIDTYNLTLAAFVPKPELEAPPPHNDALVYFILESELTIAGRRRIIYISSTDKVYGNPTGGKGIALAIDWDTDLENTVLIQRGSKVTDEMTLAELVQMLDGNPSAYNLFRKNDVWIVGDYPPFKT